MEKDSYVLKLELLFRKSATETDKDMVVNLIKNRMGLSTSVIDGRIVEDRYIDEEHSDCFAEGFLRTYHSLQDYKADYCIDSAKMKLWRINPKYPDLNGEID